jgi:hypothetical protein
MAILALSGLAATAPAQKNVVTAGVQFKPIFSSRYFSTGPQSADSSGVRFELSPAGGYCVGGLVRFGITNRVSGETGINFVKRPHRLTVDDPARGFRDEAKFSIIGYEVPVSALVFIRLSETMYMDASLGVTFDFFPSDVNSQDDFYRQFGLRKNWIFPALGANLGWEYRTYKAGYFYVGASYHRPFSDIYTSTIGYYVDDKYYTGQQFLLTGNYLTVDFRYFLHEDTLKRRRTGGDGE